MCGSPCLEREAERIEEMRCHPRSNPDEENLFTGVSRAHTVVDGSRWWIFYFQYLPLLSYRIAVSCNPYPCWWFQWRQFKHLSHAIFFTKYGRVLSPELWWIQQGSIKASKESRGVFFQTSQNHGRGNKLEFDVTRYTQLLKSGLNQLTYVH